MKKYTVGIDFGTLSARAVLLDLESGETVASSVSEYAHGVMDACLPSGQKLPPHWALQHPDDYPASLSETVSKLLSVSGVSPEAVVGLGLDFTACTAVPTDESGAPLCRLPAFSEEPNAYAKLWKQNSAQEEADDVNRLAEERGETFLEPYGGRISAEWMHPKLLQIKRQAPALFGQISVYLEAGDWLVWMLTGNLVRSAGFAGYKSLWNDRTGYPSNGFFKALDPSFAEALPTMLRGKVLPVGAPAGKLTAKGAALTGLCEGTVVSVPCIDAHASMPALGIADDGEMMLILGTSGVIILNNKNYQKIKGIAGVAKDAVLPDYYTYEAGQASCGDHFSWFPHNCVPASYQAEADARGMNLHALLREKAERLAPGESGLIALDWFNGNRSVLNDSRLSANLLGMTLHTKPEEIYRALLEGTAFSTRKVFETFKKGGVGGKRMLASGGIPEKDPLMMQIYADVLNLPITVPNVPFSASRGSAIFASVAAGAFPSLASAEKALTEPTGKTYLPNPAAVEVYDRLYAEFLTLHDYFGRGENDVMRRLSTLKEEAKRKNGKK